MPIDRRTTIVYNDFNMVNEQVINSICIYCEDEKPVKVWKETGELVCYDCRVDLLDQEFDGDK